MNSPELPLDDDGGKTRPLRVQNGSNESNQSNGSSSDAGDTQAVAASTSVSLIGMRLGDYQVMRKLGRGGMADVFVAKQISLGRDVALKVLRNEFARDQDYVRRFRREARAAAKLNHPNIVQVFDVGSVDTLHYIAQELIDGENLRQILDRHGALNLSEGLEVLIGVASALEAASEAGITHRDIKPENIMRSSRGIIKVADFGLARLGADVATSRADLTQAGLTLGTPRYMSPEQIQGQTVDVRSDLYSLGVTMYHMLAGRPPFEADEPVALAYKHLHETPVPLDRARNRKDAEGNPDLPEWLIAVVSRLMNKLPQERFQSPSELMDAVRNEASTSSVGGLGVGTAAATIRLQRAADQARAIQRRRQLRMVAAILLPLACTAVAWRMASSLEGKSVTSILSSDTVTKAETVQEQYLIAVQRDDELGWRAVSKYFPPSESTTNASYRAKSLLQLANLQVAEDRLEEADRTLDGLLNDASVDLVYQALAKARRHFVLKALKKPRAASNAKRDFQTIYDELDGKNRDARRILDRVLPPQERLLLGVEDS